MSPKFSLRLYILSLPNPNLKNLFCDNGNIFYFRKIKHWYEDF